MRPWSMVHGPCEMAVARQDWSRWRVARMPRIRPRRPGESEPLNSTPRAAFGWHYIHTVAFAF